MLICLAPDRNGKLRRVAAIVAVTEPNDALKEADAIDGWLRATAPSGVAAYEGETMWQATPGPASWAPEPDQETRDEADG